MQQNKIYPLLTNMIHPRNSPGPLFESVADVYTDSPMIAYLIEGKDEWILVDTGACDSLHSEKYHHKMTLTDDMKWENLLKPFGLSPRDIKTVVNTHLHWDHCYNNHLFEQAKIYVQKKEVEFALSPIPSQYVYYEALQIGMIPPWIAHAGRFEIIDGDYDLAEGIKLLFLPGHTTGFQGVLVETEGGKYLIAGDCVASLDNWENRQFGLPVPSGIHVDLKTYYDTLKYMTTLDAVILPGHDMRVFRHQCYPPR